MLKQVPKDEPPSKSSDTHEEEGKKKASTDEDESSEITPALERLFTRFDPGELRSLFAAMNKAAPGRWALSGSMALYLLSDGASRLPNDVDILMDREAWMAVNLELDERKLCTIHHNDLSIVMKECVPFKAGESGSTLHGELLRTGGKFGNLDDVEIGDVPVLGTIPVLGLVSQYERKLNIQKELGPLVYKSPVRKARTMRDYRKAVTDMVRIRRMVEKQGQ